jgi:hypothetical protein
VIVRFDSDVGGFIMFGDVAVTLLKLMGHSGTVPGAVLAADIPAALERLQAGVQGHVEPAPPAQDERDERREPPVSLKQRAVPLIDLLTRAARQGKDVVWR